MTYGAYPFGGDAFGAPPVPATVTPETSHTAFLLSPRASDTATITAATEVPTLPVANVQNVQPKKVYRSLSTSVSLSIGLAAPLDCTHLAIVGANLDDSAWVRLRGAAAPIDISGAPVVDTDWINPWPLGAKPDAPDWPSWMQVLNWENEDPLQYWQLDIVDGGGGLSYIDIGRLIIGKPWRPSMNFDFGGTPIAFDPRDAVAETDYGSTFTDRRTLSPPRLFDLQFSALSERDVLRGLFEIQRLAGLAGDVICCLDPADAENHHLMSMQGRFTRGGAYGAPPVFDEQGHCWSTSIGLREFL